MNEQEFFQKIELEPEYISRIKCHHCFKFNVSYPECKPNCKHKGYPTITAEHILKLEELVKLPYSFRFKNYDFKEYIVYKREAELLFVQRRIRQEALLSLISILIDKNIISKEDCRKGFE